MSDNETARQVGAVLSTSECVRSTCSYKVLLVQWHQRALDIAEQTGCVRSQGRAYGNLGLTYEALGNYERAVVFQEQHLSVAAQTNDLTAKTLAYGSLGRIHHALQNYAQAVMYLQEGEKQLSSFL